MPSKRWCANVFASATKDRAITDHSQSSLASRSLTAADVEKQIAEVARVRTNVPGITLLHGIEVDILPDGRLDFPDELLARLDIVLASLHDAAGQSPPRLMERYLGALRHPLVNLITHPANRLVGRREGYALDYDRLFAAAADTGTMLEIDGAPSHLDLDGALARRAAGAGALLAIDSDCHRASWLARQMAFGVATARRGAIEPKHVANTRPLADIRALIARKRQ